MAFLLIQREEFKEKKVTQQSVLLDQMVSVNHDNLLPACTIERTKNVDSAKCLQHCLAESVSC